jgi:archaeosortase B (VPXXXP-CTERM-specific)
MIEDKKFIAKNRVMLESLFLFFIFVVIFYIFFYEIFGHKDFSMEFTANIVVFLLNLLGVSASVDGHIITMPDFSLEVIHECVGIFSMIVYSSFVLAYPTDLKKKLVGIAFGISGLFALGVVRIVSLAIIGMLHPDIWEYFHVYFWKLNLIIFVIIFLLLWVEKVVKQGRQWNKIKFFVKFAIFLTILFVAWIPFAVTFVEIKYAAVDFIFKLLISDVKLTFPPPSFIRGIMINIVPFTALVLATPKIAIKRRIKVIILGVAVLFFLEVLTADLVIFFEGGIGERIEIFSSSVGMIFFPVVLWIVMLYPDVFPKKVEQEAEQEEKGYIKVIKEILPPDVKKEKYKCPFCKKEQENIVEHLKSKHETQMKRRKVKEFLKEHPELKL